VAVHGNFSTPERITDLVEVSKGTASVLVSVQKKFFCLGDAGFL